MCVQTGVYSNAFNQHNQYILFLIKNYLCKQFKEFAELFDQTGLFTQFICACEWVVKDAMI